ncbi:MAG: hypothetical protein LBU53_05025 [Zoogloeaceae bacterium]|jgi:hypothetical protein|nr:hypothetical protein [Zoogloeaceae bacterium]
MHIHKLLLLTIGLLLASSASGVDIKATATKAEDFVPEGWKLHSVAYGDLNRDGQEDVALVIQGTDKKKTISFSDNYGNGTLTTNPRALLIAFRKDDTYELVLKNETLLPCQDGTVWDENGTAIAERPWFDDLLDEGGIKITPGNTLKIKLDYYAPYGKPASSTITYTFRHQNSRFELIGLDAKHITPKREHSVSVNYSTGKILETIMDDDNDEPSSRTIEKWLSQDETGYDLQTLDFVTLDNIASQF